MNLQAFFSIRGKLFASFGVTLLLMVVVGVLGVLKVDAVGRDANTIGTDALPSIEAVKSVNGFSMDYQGALFDYIASTTTAERQAAATDLGQRRSAVGSILTRYARLVSNAASARHGRPCRPTGRPTWLGSSRPSRLPMPATPMVRTRRSPRPARSTSSCRAISTSGSRSATGWRRPR